MKILKLSCRLEWNFYSVQNAAQSAIGDFLKQKCAGYTAYLLTGNLDLAKKVGLRTSRRIPFFNADIECRLLKYELYTGTRKSKP